MSLESCPPALSILLSLHSSLHLTLFMEPGQLGSTLSECMARVPGGIKAEMAWAKNMANSNGAEEKGCARGDQSNSKTKVDRESCSCICNLQVYEYE